LSPLKADKDADTATVVPTTGDTTAGDPTPSAPDTSTEPTVEVSTVEAPVPTDDWIFKSDRIHSIEIELPIDAWNDLTVDPFTYVQGSFTLDGERVDEVGLRIRGKVGSFRTLSGKPKLKVDFNRFLEDQRFFGLKSLSLNSSVADCSYLKEVVAARVYDDAGVATSRTSFARVSLNGGDYGLYVIVETQDDRFLHRYMSDPSGNLYDGKYVWYGGSSYTLLDFAEGNDTLYQLEEGDDVAHADVIAISEALAATRGTDTFYTELGALIDWESTHRTWAAEQWLGQNDGYCLNKNNYRAYFHPDDGRLRFIPWDNDLTFLYAYQWGRSWVSPYGNLAAACKAHPECHSDWAEAVRALTDNIDVAALSDFIGEIDALTTEAATVDPRRECGADSIPGSRAHVATWVTQRSDQIRAEWGL
jgi:spore coat protein CotH